MLSAVVLVNLVVILVNLVVILVVLVVADVVDNTTTLVAMVVTMVVTVPVMVELVVVVVVPVANSSSRTQSRCTIMVVVQVQCPGNEAEHASAVVEWGTGRSNALISQLTKWTWLMMMEPSYNNHFTLIPYRY